MLERRQVEELLRVNGVKLTAPDEEIKSILISAQWHKDDVETALLILRENIASHETHVDTIHKVFRGDDERLSPEKITEILGVDMNIPACDVELGTTQKKRRTMSSGQVMQLCLVSLCSSVIFVMASMWFLEMGLFHVTMR